MLRSLYICLWRVKYFYQSPSSWILMIGMPLIFSFIFGSLPGGNSAGTKAVFALVGGEGRIGTEIKRLLAENQRVEWKQADLQTAKEMVKNRKVTAALIIPDDLEKRLKERTPLFEVLVQQKSSEYLTNAPFIEGVARTVASSYGFTSSHAPDQFVEVLASVAGPGGIKIEKYSPSGEQKAKNVNTLSFNFTLMFMMFGLSAASAAILDERKVGTWPRLQVTPVKRWEVITGYLFGFFLIAWSQLAILMIASSLLFGMNWGNLLLMIPFASLIIISVVGFGIMIAGFVKTSKQASVLSTILIVSTCMLGGVYWPIELTPEIMQTISLGMPQRWAMTGIQEIVSGVPDMNTLFKSSIFLILFSLLFLLVGLKRIKFEK